MFYKLGFSFFSTRTCTQTRSPTIPRISKYPSLLHGIQLSSLWKHRWVCVHTHTAFNMAPFAAESLRHVWLFGTPWTVAHQAPLPMGFSRQEYGSGLPFPSPGDLPSQGSNPCLLLGRQMLYHWAACKALCKIRIPEMWWSLAESHCQLLWSC